MWDARVAAGHCIEYICEAVPDWDFYSANSLFADNNNDSDLVQLEFDHFNIENVITKGVPLQACGTEEFNIDWGNVNSKERLALQKKLLKKSLGLDDGESNFEFVTDRDVKCIP